MNLRLTCLSFVVFAFFLSFPSDGYCWKRNKNRVHKIEFNFVEPDYIAMKAKQEGSAIQAEALDINRVYDVERRFREGIDVSHYQGRIDWDQVAGSESISYVYLKATEGASYVDDTYSRNLREVRRVGLSVGSYHFYRPNVSWEQQLENLTSNVISMDQDLVPIIDIEHRGRVSQTKFISDLKKFVQKVELHYGKKPLLYSYQNFYNKYLQGHFPDHHWMIAKYQEAKPVLEDGKDYIMWQYTQAGSLPGVEGNVDRSCIMQGFALYHVQM